MLLWVQGPNVGENERVIKLRQTIQTLREALEFYAEGNHYSCDDVESDNIFEAEILDRGKKAQKALDETQ